MLLSGNRSCIVIIFLNILFLASGPILAEDNRIKIPAPPLLPLPKIVLPSPPPMVWLPVPQVYVAHDSPHQLFHHEGHYYLYHQNVWYIGPGYAGPWTVAKQKQIPPGLRKYHGERWGEYQRTAAQHFREGRDHGHYPFYAGRENGHPHTRAQWKDNGHDRGRRGDKEKTEKRGHGRGREHDD